MVGLVVVPVGPGQEGEGVASRTRGAAGPGPAPGCWWTSPGRQEARQPPPSASLRPSWKRATTTARCRADSRRVASHSTSASVGSRSVINDGAQQQAMPVAQHLGIVLGPVVATDARPTPPGPDHGLLGQLLRRCPVTDEPVPEPPQPRVGAAKSSWNCGCSRARYPPGPWTDRPSSPRPPEPKVPPPADQLPPRPAQAPAAVLRPGFLRARFRPSLGSCRSLCSPA